MKKIIFSFVAILTISLISNAQISFGVKAGANMYNFSGDDVSEGDYKSKIGFYGGGLVNIPVTENISFQPELVYSAEGAKFDMGGTDVKVNANYLNIPVMLQFNTTSGFYAEAGPQIGFLMSAKLAADGESEDIKDSFKSTNFSVGVGLGFKLANGLGIGARYNLGLGNIAEGEGSDTKLSGLQFGLSFSFGGSKKD